MRRHTLCTTLLLAVSSLTSTAFAHGLGPASAGAYSFELEDAAGRQLPTYTHLDQTYVLGRQGERYVLRVKNLSNRRVEVVASVDGRDVLDGKPAAFAKRGYLVPPFGEVRIDGFRLSDTEVAAFRFSRVANSYAAKLGDAQDVGVIGVAVFSERLPPAITWRHHPSSSAGSLHRDEAAREGASAAPSAAAKSSAEQTARPERPGLGTEFGEAHTSWVQSVAFERESEEPDAVLSLRYNDREGLRALGIDVDGRRRLASEQALRDRAEPFRQDTYARPPPGWSR